MISCSGGGIQIYASIKYYQSLGISFPECFPDPWWPPWVFLVNTWKISYNQFFRRFLLWSLANRTILSVHRYYQSPVCSLASDYSNTRHIYAASLHFYGPKIEHSGVYIFSCIVFKISWMFTQPPGYQAPWTMKRTSGYSFRVFDWCKQ